VLAFTLLLATLTGILFGLVPALHASRADLGATLKEAGSRTGSGRRQNRARGALVVAEMALAIVLLVGAGLLIRTFLALHQVPPGFDPHNVLTMNTALTGTQFEKTATITDAAPAHHRTHRSAPWRRSRRRDRLSSARRRLWPWIRDRRPPLTNGTTHGGAGWAYVTARILRRLQSFRRARPRL
jgi:hypothetical protein